MPEKKTLGKLPREAIRLLEIPRLPASIVDGFKALVDLTGTISDACDELGIVGVVSAYELPPVNSGKRIVGQAVTVRNIRHATQIHKAAQDNASGQGETEAHNLAAPGDVLVMQGVMGCSNMGGQSATIARREGYIGAIVDGTLRDPDQYREMGWPVWCRGFTPITGKWRMQTVEVNGTAISSAPTRQASRSCRMRRPRRCSKPRARSTAATPGERPTSRAACRSQ